MTVELATIRQDVYSALRTLLVANKPTYDISETTHTYSIVAEYGRADTAFPCIVLNKAEIDIQLLNIDGSGENAKITVQLDLYALELHRKVAIDAGLDSVQNTILNNQDDFKDDDNLLLQQDPFDESNTTPFNDNQQLLNTASLIVKLELK